MGHLRLGSVPDRAAWHRVIDLIADDASTETVAAATLEAAVDGLNSATHDRAVHRVVELLAEICQAAGDRARLKDRGLALPADADSVDLVTALAGSIEARLRATPGPRTDFAEMAKFAAVEALAEVCTKTSGLLYAEARGDVQETLRGLASPSGFEAFAHQFFARFTYRFLGYHLSRQLSVHVGTSERFAGPDEHNGFLERLAAFSTNASSVVREFAAGWYARHSRQGPIPAEEAHGFAAYALTKVRRAVELRGRGDAR